MAAQADVGQEPVEETSSGAEVSADVAAIGETADNSGHHDDGDHETERRIFPAEADDDENDGPQSVLNAASTNDRGILRHNFLSTSRKTAILQASIIPSPSNIDE